MSCRACGVGTAGTSEVATWHAGSQTRGAPNADRDVKSAAACAAHGATRFTILPGLTPTISTAPRRQLRWWYHDMDLTVIIVSETLPRPYRLERNSQ